MQGSFKRSNRISRLLALHQHLTKPMAKRSTERHGRTAGVSIGIPAARDIR